ncbi:MAG: T9SS type A sorting domain-containing protein [Bacteroidota bacterium]
MKNVLSLVLALASFFPLFATRYYVAADATGNNDGSSWDHAYNHPSDAFAAAGWSGSDTIWVKAGTYKPDRTLYGSSGSGNSREWVFFCPKPVVIMGGFSGSEVSYSQRDWENNATILDGDVGTQGDNSDNTYHVVFLGNGNWAELDGFTIQNGNANSGSNQNGAGIQVSGVSTATLRNLVLRSNTATGNGAGLHFSNLSSGSLENIYAFDNVAQGNGGGFYLASLNGVNMTKLISYQNQAQNGAGLYCSSLSNLTLEAVALCGNYATNDGGGMHATSFANVNLVNCCLTNNSAANNAAGYYCDNFSNCNFTNTTVYGNTATGDYGGLYATQCSGTYIYNSIIWGNEDQNGTTHTHSQLYRTNNSANMEVSYSSVEGTNGSGAGWSSSFSDMGNNIEFDPILTNRNGTDGIACTADDNFVPSSSSNVINVGLNTAPGVTPFDPNGNDRIQDGTIDLGAFEGSVTFPVEWLDFKGEQKGKAIELNWSTATEIQSYEFEIQRMEEFSGMWQKVGSTAAAGYSSTVQTYSFMDSDIPQQGWVRYRLKQTDIDGGFDFSHTIEVRLQDQSHDIKPVAVPNPGTGIFNLTLLGTTFQEGQQVMIKDMMGHTLLTQEIKANGMTEVALDLSSFPTGYYFIQLAGHGKTSYAKYLKK